LLSALDGIKFKNNNKWKQNINHHDWYLLDWFIVYYDK
jgi:hypothetical protein